MRCLNRFLVPTCIIVWFALPAYAGKFVFGMNRRVEVTLKMPMPPQVSLEAKTVRVDVVQAPSAFGDSDRLLHSIEQSLTPDFSISSDKADAILSVTVASFDPPNTWTNTQTETRTITVQQPAYNQDGTPQLDANGNAVTQSAIQVRQVPVVYWHASGTLSLLVQTRLGDGSRQPDFTPIFTFGKSAVVSVNDESQPEAANLPDASAILDALISNVAYKFKLQYCRTEVDESFLLAVDDELRPSDALAQAGSWESALKQWQDVKMKKNEGDRLYNMGAAYEALAYAKYSQTGSMEDTLALFKKSQELYNQAIQLDPKEKYIQQSRERLATANKAMEKAQEQYLVEKAKADEITRRQKEEEMLATKRKQQLDEVRATLNPDDTPRKVDTPQDAKFRSLVSMRLQTATEPLAKDVVEKLTQDGETIFHLDAASAQQVVLQQEIVKSDHAANLDKYQSYFADFAADQRITAEERSALHGLKDSLKLSDRETRSVESEFQFVEEGKGPRHATRPGGPKKLGGS